MHDEIDPATSGNTPASGARAAFSRPIRLAPSEVLSVPEWDLTPLGVAAALLLVDLASWSWLRLGYYEGVPIGLAGIVGVVFTTLHAVRRPGGWPSAVLVAVQLVTLAACIPFISGRLTATLVVAAAAEEVAYRIALPVLLRAAATRLGASPAAATWAAVLVSATVFAVLPGHVGQYGLLGPLPWFAAAMLWTWLLMRGASLASVVLTHAAFNAVGFAALDGAPYWWRPVAIGLGPLLFVGTCTYLEHRWRSRGEDKVCAP